MNEDTIVRFSASGRTVLLVSEGKVYSDIRRDYTRGGGVKVRQCHVDSENVTNNRS